MQFLKNYSTALSIWLLLGCKTIRVSVN